MLLILPVNVNVCFATKVNDSSVGTERTTNAPLHLASSVPITITGAPTEKVMRVINITVTSLLPFVTDILDILKPVSPSLEKNVEYF